MAQQQLDTLAALGEDQHSLPGNRVTLVTHSHLYITLARGTHTPWSGLLELSCATHTHTEKHIFFLPWKKKNKISNVLADKVGFIDREGLEDSRNKSRKSRSVIHSYCLYKLRHGRHGDQKQLISLPSS